MTDVPFYKVMDNTDCHTSFTAIDFFSLCQRLAFPCVWVSAKHETDVPAPSQLNQLPRGVIARICHEWIVVW